MENKYFASCPRGFEETLLQELTEFGVKDSTLGIGGVAFKTDYSTLFYALLHSRIASRIYKSLFQFEAHNENELYKQAVILPWNKLMNIDQTFKINTLLDKELSRKFKNSMVLNLKLKDALVDQYRKAAGARPSVSKKHEDFSFLLRGEGFKNTGKFEVLVDLCGKPLSNRGYRAPGHMAPLRENVAAGLVLLSDWNPDEDLFIDLFCGTGTILIEAILIKAKVAPAYLRVLEYAQGYNTFSFLNHKWYQKNDEAKDAFGKWSFEVKNKTPDLLDSLDANQFFGNDIDFKITRLAESSLKRMHIPRGVVTFSNDPAQKIKPPGLAPGMILSNPPYGERLEGKWEKLYYDLGENLKQNWKDFRAYLLTSNPQLRKKVSLQTSKRIPVWNGQLECRLLEYKLF